MSVLNRTPCDDEVMHHAIRTFFFMQVTQRLSSVERSAVSAGPRASAGMERDRIRISILDEAAIVCHAYLSLFFPGVYERGFLILSKTKETPGLSNPIG